MQQFKFHEVLFDKAIHVMDLSKGICIKHKNITFKRKKER